MALKINTDSLKTIQSLVIECQFIQQLGLEVFNNIGTVSPEYAEICDALRGSCGKLATDIEKLKSEVPVVVVPAV
jgi:hypothetical protein